MLFSDRGQNIEYIASVINGILIHLIWLENHQISFSKLHNHIATWSKSLPWKNLSVALLYLVLKKRRMSPVYAVCMNCFSEIVSLSHKVALTKSFTRPYFYLYIDIKLHTSSKTVFHFFFHFHFTVFCMIMFSYIQNLK